MCGRCSEGVRAGKVGPAGNGSTAPREVPTPTQEMSNDMSVPLALRGKASDRGYASVSSLDLASGRQSQRRCI